MYPPDISARYIEKGTIPDARTGDPGAAQRAEHARVPAQEAPGRHAGRLLAGVLRLALSRTEATPAGGRRRDDLPEGAGRSAQERLPDHACGRVPVRRTPRARR